MSAFFEARTWWTFALRGIVAVLFGALLWATPSMTLVTLVRVFGVYAIADGVLALSAAAARKVTDRPHWQTVVYGGASVTPGILALFAPHMTALALSLLIALRSIATGAVEISAGYRLRNEIPGERLLAASGVLSIAFGALVVLFHRVGAFALLAWIGAYTIFLGALLIALGLELQRIERGAVPRLA
jgi:uncharacterized membrane protein HdeD (DUF308 family)